MKVLHTSDWHLGIEFNERNRDEEFRQFLAWLLEKIKEEGVETLNKFASTIDTEKMKAPSFKMILTAVGNLAYKREDGIYIVPISCLKH